MTCNDQRIPRATSRSEANPARRRLLKALTAGGAGAAAVKSLPERWTKPVVDTVMLPAHAQATAGRFQGGGSAAVVTPPGPGPGGAQRLLDLLVPAAHAGTKIASMDVVVCIDVAGATAFNARVLLTADQGSIEEEKTLSGNGGTLGQFLNLGDKGGFQNVKVKAYSLSGSSIKYEISFYYQPDGSHWGASGELGPGGCPIA